MREAFQDDLDAITNTLTEMCNLACGAMVDATKAILEADLALRKLFQKMTRLTHFTMT
jgi:hypothetical protein